MEEFWNKRYDSESYIYGKEPNVFFRCKLDEITPGRILLPAEGEGRNGIYAARCNWEVDAFDLSVSGQMKAMNLADEYGVQINYKTGSMDNIPFAGNTYDVVALLFAHWPESLRAANHQKLISFLKPGGFLILEGFSKLNLQYTENYPQIGGPRDIGMLFSVDEIKSDFADLEILILEAKEVELSEGENHKGTGHVVNFVGRYNG